MEALSDRRNGPRQPVFVLAPHRSFTSLLSTMLGQHPQLYGLPETNLFVADTVSDWLATYRGGAALGGHGLLRAVAELVFRGQSDATVVLARRWLHRRWSWPTSRIFAELAERAHPAAIVEKSPRTASRPEHLHRLLDAAPRARFVHVTRHPRSHGASLLASLAEVGVGEGALSSWLRAGGDPQQSWYQYHANICQFLSRLPPAQFTRIRGEDLLADPDRGLSGLARWLRVRADAAAVEDMKHPERSPFACPGPPLAPLGNDPHLLRQPAFRPRPLEPQRLEGPLEWRRDGRGFTPDVQRLARKLGYE
jgi:Sulfotransferase family